MAESELVLDLPDEASTLALGRRLAAIVRAGDVIALSGELGAGKTTLARGLIGALAERAGLKPEEMPSPSFPIVQTYELGTLTLWHFDLYRIEDPRELEELGFDEALGGLVLIEWPELAQSLIPENRISIRIEWSGEGRRAFLAGRLQSGHLDLIREQS